MCHMYCSQVTNRRSHSLELCDCCIIIIFVMLVVLCGGQVLTPLPYFLKNCFSQISMFLWLEWGSMQSDLC